MRNISQALRNVVKFDHKSGEFIRIKLNETIIEHLDIQSTILHVDSEEAKIQLKEGENENIDENKRKKTAKGSRDKSEESDEDGDEKRKLMFSFIERFTQTKMGFLKSTDTQTPTSEKATFSGNVS